MFNNRIKFCFKQYLKVLLLVLLLSSRHVKSSGEDYSIKVGDNMMTLNLSYALGGDYSSSEYIDYWHFNTIYFYTSDSYEPVYGSYLQAAPNTNIWAGHCGQISGNCGNNVLDGSNGSISSTAYNYYFCNGEGSFDESITSSNYPCSTTLQVLQYSAQKDYCYCSEAISPTFTTVYYQFYGMSFVLYAGYQNYYSSARQNFKIYRIEFVTPTAGASFEIHSCSYDFFLDESGYASSYSTTNCNNRLATIYNTTGGYEVKFIYLKIYNNNSGQVLELINYDTDSVKGYSISNNSAIYIAKMSGGDNTVVRFLQSQDINNSTANGDMKDMYVYRIMTFLVSVDSTNKQLDIQNDGTPHCKPPYSGSSCAGIIPPIYHNMYNTNRYSQFSGYSAGLLDYFNFAIYYCNSSVNSIFSKDIYTNNIKNAAFTYGFWVFLDTYDVSHFFGVGLRAGSNYFATVRVYKGYGITSTTVLNNSVNENALKVIFYPGNYGINSNDQYEFTLDDPYTISNWVHIKIAFMTEGTFRDSLAATSSSYVKLTNLALKVKYRKVNQVIRKEYYKYVEWMKDDFGRTITPQASFDVPLTVEFTNYCNGLNQPNVIFIKHLAIFNDFILTRFEDL